MEDIFSLEFDKAADKPKMTADEFISKTQKLLKQIERDYSNAWGWRKIKEEEFKVTPCNACKGEMSFEFCGRKINCVADKINGECAERYFDKDEFINELEAVMFHSEEAVFYNLMDCEIVD